MEALSLVTNSMTKYITTAQDLLLMHEYQNMALIKKNQNCQRLKSLVIGPIKHRRN
jgi:hypothetical protein